VLKKAISLTLLSVLTIVPQIYLAMHPEVNLDFFWLFAAVIIPILISYLLLRNSIFLFYSYAGIFFSIIDDAPVHFDSVFTWPEVTRYNPAFHHFFMEVILHFLTLVLLLVSINIFVKKVENKRKKIVCYSLGLVSSFLCYAQNTPLDFIQAVVESNWYFLDIFEHFVAIFLLILSFTISSEKRVPGASQKIHPM
jgi:hypothetical protein